MSGRNQRSGERGRPGYGRAMQPYDEALDRRGLARAHYAEALATLHRLGPAALAREATARARAAGLAVGDRALAVDPVPRIIPQDEWAPLAAGLAERAAALDALARSAYAPGAPELLTTSHYFEPDLVGAPDAGPAVSIVGFDVVRGADGGLRVLEANVLSPGHAALPAARELGSLAERMASPPLPTREATLRAYAAMLGDDPDAAAILGDPGGSWELRWLGAALGVPVVAPADLVADARGVRLRADGRPLAVLWQRTAEDRLRDDAGAPTPAGRVLLEPARAGTVRVVNRPGAGVVHDKRALPLLEASLDRPLVPAVPTLLLERDEDRAAVLAEPAAFVVKPATGAGGRDVRFGAAMTPGELRRLATLEARHWVAQPVVALSVHPTVEGDAVVPRPVDLRVFAVHTGDGWTVLPGGVSRYPTAAGTRVVNTSAGGGIKDVWVLPGAPASGVGHEHHDERVLERLVDVRDVGAEGDQIAGAEHHGLR